jgi:glycosyltransferase involved in cell wall biosynthesis
MADLSGDCCVTVPTGDTKEMAKVVMELVENPDKYETLRLRAHSWAKDHDINWHVGELKKLYFPENG